MRLASAALLALVACQPYRPTLETTCFTSPPASSRVGDVRCAAAVPSGGEGRNSDTLLATPGFSAVIRGPTTSLTLPGVGGGTVVDLAPWGLPDVVHEIVPTIDGAAFATDAFEIDEDSVTVGGPLVAVPGGPAVAAGARGAIRWHADGPWLVAEGADALRLHLRGDVVLREGRFWVGDVVVVPGGPSTDLGGVVVIDGDRVLVAAASDTPTWSDTPTREATGVTAGSRLAWRRGDAMVARWQVSGAFSALVPSDWTDVRAEADGLGAGPWTPIATGLDLPIGAGGAITLQTNTSVVVRFAGDTDAPAVRVGTASATLPLGEGRWRLDVTGGPAFDPRSVDVVITTGETATADVALTARFDPGNAVLVAAPWPTDRDRTWRGSAATALLDAAAAGVDYAVLAPRDEVAGATDSDDPGGLQWVNGAWSTHPTRGAIVSWPWTASARFAGHGAIDTGPLSPIEALAAAWGGPGTDRYTAVDLAWLEAVGSPPQNVIPRPDVVLLDDPGDDPAESWRPWWRWLDAGVPLVPLGPFAWAPVENPRAFGPVEVERALVEDRWTATTGPPLALRVGRARPGGLSPAGDVSVRADAAFDQVWLIGEGGRVVDAWRPGDLGHEGEAPRPAGAWIVAVATGPHGAWAATAPIWLTRRP